MADTLKLTILSPERRVLDDVEATSVILPGSEGQIQVLPGHAAMIGTLQTGMFGYTAARDGQEQVGVISTGFFEVKDDRVKVMAETIELRKEINVARAKTAQKNAEEGLQKTDLDESQFRKYQLKLERSLIRQQVATRGHE